MYALLQKQYLVARDNRKKRDPKFVLSHMSELDLHRDD